MIRPILIGAWAWPAELVIRSAARVARTIPSLRIETLLSASSVSGLDHDPVRGVKAAPEPGRRRARDRACVPGSGVVPVQWRVPRVAPSPRNTIVHGPARVSVADRVAGCHGSTRRAGGSP